MGEEVGKIFVGGVDRNTHPDAFRGYFEKFGKVSDLILMPDKEKPGQNKGFGFVTYQDPACISDIVSNKNHMLDGRELDVKPCRARGSEPRRGGGGGGGGGDQRTRKVFVGGISQQASIEDLKELFSKYGMVEDVHIMTDNETGKHRGFGFVTLDSEDAVEKLVRLHHVELKGKSMEIKRAQPKQNRGFGGQMGGGGGYQGGGGGSWNQGGQGGYGAGGNGYGGGNQYGGSNQWNQDPFGQRGGNQGYGGQQQQGYNNGYRQQQQGYSQQPQQAAQGYGAGAQSYNSYGGYGVTQQDPYGQQQQQYGNQGSMGNYAQEASGYGPQRGNYNQAYGQGQQQQPQQPQQTYGQADSAQDYGNYGKANMGGNQFHPYSR